MEGDCGTGVREIHYYIWRICPGCPFPSIRPGACDMNGKGVRKEQIYPRKPGSHRSKVLFARCEEAAGSNQPVLWGKRVVISDAEVGSAPAIKKSCARKSHR